MKVAISFPPLDSKKGTPLLSQNRQFQWFSDPTYIYPVIPASAATLLSKNGFDVFWDDAIAEELSYKNWLKRIIKEKPDFIAIETKTPVIKRHWNIIAELKKISLEIGNWKLKIALMGDHITALPDESLQNSMVDFVLVGGDYDFLLLKLLKLLKQNQDGKNIQRIVSDSEKKSLDELPPIDRKLTQWKNYAFKNGNYKYTPGAYVMNARDCWWGKCSFCSWTTIFPGERFRTRSEEKALDEIGNLIELGAREIMEDSGTLPIGSWLENFCHGMIERGYSKKVVLDCNMRINAIKDPGVWKLMKRAGFRMILFGVESANQKTLDRIEKNLRIEEIEPALRSCKNAGLEPHVTFMIGWPWENIEDANQTVNYAKKMFQEGFIDSLQATIAIPYPGTPLFRYCKENKLLLTENYDRYDQREPVMKSALSKNDLKKMTRRIYRSSITPKFLFKKARSVRGLRDLKFFFKSGKKILGHLKDFS